MGSTVGMFPQRTWKMKDFGRGDKYLNIIQHQVPRVLRQANTKLERRGNTQTDTDIKVTPLLSAKKSSHFDPRGSFCGFVAHFCCNLVHISVEEGLRFEVRDANHLVLDGSLNDLRLL